MLAVPFQVGAAAAAGDLIKIDGYAPVYYLGADGKRYVFPNVATYNSWYSDFSGVKTLPQSEVESYPLAANVVVRAGTKLIKRPVPTDPKVYAVLPGAKLLWIADEATAKALYGNDWAKRVVDVVDSFFVNYTIQSGQASATAFPAGSLVKYGTGADVYYVNTDGTVSKIANEAAFLGNKFSWDNIITTTLAKPTQGADITAAVGSIIDTSQGGGATGPVARPGVGTGLTVALASDTAVSNNLPSLAALVPFTTVNLTASNDGDVTLNDITFTRTGTGVTGDILGAYLFAGDQRLTNLKTVNSSDNKVTFNSVGLVIPKGTTKSVTLKVNAADSASGNHAFRVTAASDIVTDGAAVNGSFPVTGNLMSYSSAVDAAVITLTTANTDDASDSDKKVGETNVVLGEFNINNGTNAEDVNIYRIRLKQDGDAANNAVNSMSLDLDGTVVASNVSMVDKFVDFVLPTPYLLKKSRQITATVRGNIITDINKTVQLYLNNTADFDARGTAYGDFYSAAITNTGLNATNADKITIKGSAINVSFDGPLASDVKDDTDNIVFANFMIKADNEDVNIESLPITIEMNATGSAVALQNVEMVDTTNNASYSVTADPSGLALSQTVVIENVTLRKGTQYKFAIRGDVQNAVAAGQTYKVGFTTSGLTGTYTQSDTAVSASDFSASSLTGQIMTVADPKITMSKVTANNATVVKNTKGVAIFNGKLTANNVDDLRLSRIKFNQTGSLTTLAASYDRVALYKIDSAGAETLVDDETSLSASSVIFSGFTLNIPKGTANEVKYVVRADVKSTPTAGTSTLALGTTSDMTVRDADSNALTAGQFTITSTNGQVITITTAGSYTANMDVTESGTNTNQNVLAGGKALVGRIKFTATNEIAKIVDLYLVNSGTAASQDITSLTLYKEKAMTTAVGSAEIDANGFAKFEGINFEIPTTGITYLYVGANVAGVDYSASPIGSATARAGRTVVLNATSTATFNTKVTGVSTGDELSDASLGAAVTKTSTVMGAVMSNITSGDTTVGTLAAGQQALLRFKVTAPSQTTNNVDFDGANLGIKIALASTTLATSTDINVGSYKVERVGGADGKKDASVTVNGSTVIINFATTYGAGSDLIVRPGETAEYIVYGTVSGIPAGGGSSVTMSIDNVNSDITYTHNTGVAGVDGADTTPVFPLLSGVTTVKSGTLSN